MYLNYGFLIGSCSDYCCSRYSFSSHLECVCLFIVNFSKAFSCLQFLAWSKDWQSKKNPYLSYNIVTCLADHSFYSNQHILFLRHILLAPFISISYRIVFYSLHYKYFAHNIDRRTRGSSFFIIFYHHILCSSENSTF